MTSGTQSKVVEITTKEEFQEQVVGAKKPVLVDLWAPWCGPCRAQGPIIEEVAEQAGDKALVVKVNVDNAVDIAEQLGVNSIPTLVVFKNGQEAKRFVGVQSAQKLLDALGI